MSEYNIYCDESCHLENDHCDVMILGAVWCPQKKVTQVFERLREIKVHHGLKSNFELKWTKVSTAKIDYYKDVLDYFFDNGDLNFRALIVPDKTKLQHERFNQTHDTWYFKMYFDMLKIIIDPEDCFNIYLDIKDTRSSRKVKKLHEVLSNANYDFSQTIIRKFQTVRSHEVELIQLADFLIGIVSYANRGLATSKAKLELVSRMRERSGYSLVKTTLMKEKKVNIFKWLHSEVI